MLSLEIKSPIFYEHAALHYHFRYISYMEFKRYTCRDRFLNTQKFPRTKYVLPMSSINMAEQV